MVVESIDLDMQTGIGNFKINHPLTFQWYAFSKDKIKADNENGFKKF
nr:hypothetical protein [Mycoplasmopsis bovis]